MIIYYNKQTGKIIQTIQDRIHNPTLERSRPTINGVNKNGIGILIIKFIPDKPNSPYKPDVDEKQAELIYELEKTGEINKFSVKDNSLVKETIISTSSSQELKITILDLRSEESEIFDKVTQEIKNNVTQTENLNLDFYVGTHRDKDKFLKIINNEESKEYFKDLNRFVRWKILTYFVGNEAVALILPTKIPELRIAYSENVAIKNFLIWNVIKDIKELGFEFFNINLEGWGGTLITEAQLNKLRVGKLKFDSLA